VTRRCTEYGCHGPMEPTEISTSPQQWRCMKCWTLQYADGRRVIDYSLDDESASTGDEYYDALPHRDRPWRR